MSTRICYTPDQLNWLRSNYAVMGLSDLTAGFNSAYGTDKTAAMIRSALRNHRIRCGRTTGQLNKGNYRLVTPEMAAYIAGVYPDYTRKQLTEHINQRFDTAITVAQLTAFVKNHKIRSGRSGRFTAGTIPVNKGTKGLTGANKTSFSPGNPPANIRDIGSERLDKDGMILIKVPVANPYTGSATRYIHKHIWIWEQANGPRPPNTRIIFKDGDRTNCDISNLLMVSAAEHICLNINGYRSASPDIKPSIMALSKLEAKAGVRTRKRPEASCP